MVSGRHWNETMMTMKHEEIEKYQLEKIRKQLRYENDASQYFRERLAKGEKVPERIKNLEELQSIPLFTKEDHRTSQEESLKKFGHPYGLHLCAPAEDVVNVNATSGTTGTPTFYTFTRKDLLTNSECSARALWLAGIRPGDTVLLGFALSMFVGGLPLALSIQHLGAKVIPVGAEAGSRRLLQFALLTKPNVMILTPSFAEHLIEKCPETTGKKVGDLGIRTIICGGEPGAGDPAVRARIEDAFGAKVYDFMGGAYGFMSICCENHQGMHLVTPDYIYLELIHPETKERLRMEDGAVGTIAYTSLEWEAGPVLRYDMGDVTQVFVSPCKCGLTGPRLKVLGRTDDMLIVKGINVYPAAVKNLVMEFFPKTTGEMRVVITSPGPKAPAPLHIKVEHGKGEENLIVLRQEIESRIHDVLRFKAEVELVPENTFDRTSTKTSLVEKRF